MKTIILNEDGFLIGFGDPQIDPVETKKAITEKLKNTPAQKKIKNNMATINGYRKSRNNAMAKIKNSFMKYGERVGMPSSDLELKANISPALLIKEFNNDEKNLLTTGEADIIKFEGLEKQVINENALCYKEFEQEKRDLIISDAVYFELKPNEYEVDLVNYEKILSDVKSLDTGWKLKVNSSTFKTEKVSPTSAIVDEAVESVPK